ncbi:DUF1877 domain-containing protein [Streptomyces populi]|uniref:DUF1877 domain-containing protein n=1 Tax=Streptomyces populi TaxID=2058924 RepID=A0A2I0SKP4_9ACTN|nr:YfbM family protein [Streptomyces populi]PKT70480.1 DUF1877 domain-containing protein [Streptomyces populi]
MSMIGEYFRVTAPELERAIQDPDWALDFIEETEDAQEESEPPPAEARHFSTYKTWALLGFLLRRTDFPVDVIHGEEGFAETEDWGYGPPRYLPAERVRRGAEALAGTTYDELLVGLDPEELNRADVYPLGWDTPDSLEWGREYHSGLVQFFGAAARDGDAILVWLD